MKWQGKGVSEGLAMAQIHLFTPKLPEISRQPAADAEAEVAKLEATLAAAEEELRGLYETAKEKMGEQEAEIFDAHLTILGDEYSVREPIIQRIREQKQNAAAAITDQFDELAQMFRSLGDELMAERAADAEDLKQQLLRICLGCGRQDLSVLPGDVIVLAEELTPSDTVRMDTAHVKGHRHEARRARRRTAPSLRARSHPGRCRDRRLADRGSERTYGHPRRRGRYPDRRPDG